MYTLLLNWFPLLLTCSTTVSSCLLGVSFFCSNFFNVFSVAGVPSSFLGLHNQAAPVLAYNCVWGWIEPSWEFVFLLLLCWYLVARKYFWVTCTPHRVSIRLALTLLFAVPVIHSLACTTFASLSSGRLALIFRLWSCSARLTPVVGWSKAL